MTETWQVVLAGEGGQGLVLAGILLAEAASLNEEKYAVQTQSYGIATRGGFSKSEVVISTKEIIYPGVEEPDLVLALTPETYELYARSLPPEAVLVYDTSLIDAAKMPASTARTHGFPFTDTARELGRTGVANLISLGAIAALTNIVRTDSLAKTIQRHFSGKMGELNLNAYHQGFILVENIHSHKAITKN